MSMQLEADLKAIDASVQTALERMYAGQDVSTDIEDMQHLIAIAELDNLENRGNVEC